MSRLGGIGMAMLAIGVGLTAGNLLRAQTAPDPSPSDVLTGIVEDLAPSGITENLDTLLEKRDEDRATYLLKRSALREECAQALRRANRDQQWSATVHCVRTELQLEASTLRSFIAAAKPFAGDNPSVAAALHAGEALQSALATVIDAIDNGVYDTDAPLLQTRQRLQERYRLPFAHAELQLRWDTIRASLLMAAAAAQQDPIGLTTETASCLRTGTDKVLAGMNQTAYGTSALAAADVAAFLRDCAVHTETQPESGSGSVAS